MSGMEYQMEELVPIVAKLAGRYTGGESTSITYEMARQLMDAVIYCIEETGREEGQVAGQDRMAAEEAYLLGSRMVLEKTERAKQRYNRSLEDFSDYGNQAYYDIYVKGIPSFFIRYDPKFNPQDHLLTLDYPVLIRLEHLAGVDRIEQYIKCVELEQAFLKQFPHRYPEELMRSCHGGSEELLINVAGLVMRHVLICMMMGKPVGNVELSAADFKGLEEKLRAADRDSVEKGLAGLLKTLIGRGYGGNQELYGYLAADLAGFGLELKNASEHGNLHLLVNG